MTFQDVKNEVVEEVNSKSINGEQICKHLAEIFPGEGRPEGFDHIGEASMIMDIADVINSGSVHLDDTASLLMYSTGLVNARKFKIDILALRKACDIDGLKKKYLK